METGYAVNALEIAPNFAGTVFGVMNTFGGSTGFLATITVGVLTNGKVIMFILYSIYCNIINKKDNFYLIDFTKFNPKAKN